METKFTGGCQCGAVRYEGEAVAGRVHYCHCRMCQRAFGNIFATLVPFARAQFRWTRGAPRLYRSSPLAERGFCADCGTPLSFQYVASGYDDRIAVSLGSLDDPNRVAPVIHYGVESKVAWFAIDDGLPRERTEDDPDFLALCEAAGLRTGSKAP